MGRTLLLAALMAAVAAAQRPILDCRSTLRDLSAAEFPDQANLRAFYEPAAYYPAWVRDGKPTRQAQAMIQALRAASAKGLNAEDYDGSWLAVRFERLRQAAPRPSDPDIARFDLRLTVSAMRYVSDLHRGRVDPKLIHSGFDLEHEKLDIPAFVRGRLVEASDLQAVLSEIDRFFESYPPGRVGSRVNAARVLRVVLKQESLESTSDRHFWHLPASTPAHITAPQCPKRTP